MNRESLTGSVDLLVRPDCQARTGIAFEYAGDGRSARARLILVFLMIGMLASVTLAQSPVDFQWLHDWLGEDPNSRGWNAMGISADGRIVVGSGALEMDPNGVVTYGACYWLDGMGPFPLTQVGQSSSAWGVSADGTKIVGFTFTETSQIHFYSAIVWDRNGGVTLFPNQTQGSSSFGRGISADGSTVVGYFDAGTGSNPVAFAWTLGGEVKYYGDPNNPIENHKGSGAWGVSADGSYIVGELSGQFDGDKGAFRWNPDRGEFATFGGEWAQAFGCSMNGDYVVGTSLVGTEGCQGAFRRGPNGSLLTLNGLAACYSAALGVSSDGSTIVGYSVPQGIDEEAFIWDTVYGTRRLMDVLLAYGIDEVGDSSAATGLVDGCDEIVVVGNAYNRSLNRYEGFRVILPRPEIPPRRWTAAAGGMWSEGANWNPACAPIFDSARNTYTAILDLEGAYSITGSGATAARLLVKQGEPTLSGEFSMGSTSASEPSVDVGGGAKLNIAAGTLFSVNSRVGWEGPSNAGVSVFNTGTLWTNSGSLTIGDAAGGDVTVTGGASLVTQSLELAALFPSSMIVEDSQLTSNSAVVGSNEFGNAAIQGPAAVWQAGELTIGDLHDGWLSVERGAKVSASTCTLGADSFVTGPAKLSVFSVDPNAASFDVTDILRVGQAAPAIVNVFDGGRVSARQISITSTPSASPSSIVIGTIAGSSGMLANVSTLDDLSISPEGGGDATVEVGSEGGLDVGKDLWIGPSGNGTLKVSGGVTVAGTTHVGGQLLLEGGVLTTDHLKVILSEEGLGAGHSFVSILSGPKGETASVHVHSLEIESGTVEAAGDALIDVDSFAIGVNPAKVPGVEGNVNRTVALGRADEPGLSKTRMLGGAGPFTIGTSAPGDLQILGNAELDLSGATTPLLVGMGRRGSMLLEGIAEVGSADRPKLLLGKAGMTIGADAAPGVVELKNAAKFDSDGDINIGGLGTGELTISGQPTDDFLGEIKGALRVGVGAAGTLRIDSAALYVNELRIGGFQGSALAQFSGGGGVFVRGNDTSTGGKLNYGAVIGDGGLSARLEMCGPGTLNDQGRLNVSSTPGGLLIGKKGVLKGKGYVVGNTMVQGGLEIGCSPGTLTIEGDYEQTDEGTLVIEVAGTEPGEYSTLVVTGNVTLAGTLELHFVNGFVPTKDVSVPFLKGSGALTGGFGSIVATQDGEPLDTAFVATLGDDGEMHVQPADEVGAGQSTNCGAGLCGAGTLSTLPLMLVGLVCAKYAHKNSQKSRQRGR